MGTVIEENLKLTKKVLVYQGEFESCFNEKKDLEQENRELNRLLKLCSNRVNELDSPGSNPYIKPGSSNGLLHLRIKL